MEVDWGAITSEIMGEVIRILIPLFVMLILKWGVEIWTKLKAKNPQLADLLEKAGRLGYAAAEEYFRGQNVLGDRKMLYAIDRADDYLKENGVTVPMKVIQGMITDYGVTEYKFNWTKPTWQKMIESTEDEEESEETEGD